MSLVLRPIGRIEGPYMDVHAMPVQSRLNPDEVGRIRIFEEFVAGLDGLAGFDFAHVITLLNADDPEGMDVDLRPTPLLLQGTGRHIGLFATRFPRRPNSLGLSLIQLLSVAGDTIEFAGVDMIDGTPVLDIKPWVPTFDIPANRDLGLIRTGWYADVDFERERRKAKKPDTG